MRIHTDSLYTQNLRNVLPPGVYVEITCRGSRKRDHAFEVTLSTDHGTKHRNSSAEAQGEYAASWDEWGLFLAALFAIDHGAIMGDYNGSDDFRFKTGGHYGDGSKPLPVTCPNHKWKSVAPCHSECAKGCGAVQRWGATT